MSFFEDAGAPANAPKRGQNSADAPAGANPSAEAAIDPYADYYSRWNEPQQTKPRRVKTILGYVFTFLFVAGVSYAFNAPSPYVIEQPGTVFNVLASDEGSPIISIDGQKTYEDKGKLFLLTVGLDGQPGNTPSWVKVLQAWLDPKKKVLPVDAVFAPDTKATDSTALDLAMMKDSQIQATAAALRQLGYTFDNQVQVLDVDKKGPAFGLLKVDDAIIKADGKVLANGDTLRAQVSAHAAKKPLDLTLLRDGKTIEVSIAPKKLYGAWRLGISIADSYKFPFDVNLKLQNVGGPSGGMMFALGIIDKLTPGSLTGGQAVAGTGTINGLGEVGPIGGIQQKMWGAQDAGATWFLAPETNCDEVVGHVPDGMHVTKVSTLEDALVALKAIAANPNTTALPKCAATK